MPVTLNDVQRLPPDRFEVLAAALLEAKGFRNVLSLGGAGDEGVDLRAEWVEELPTGHTRMTLWAVQCKRYLSSISQDKVAVVLNSALEPPYDLLVRRPDFFLIVTTSRLTPNAHRLVTRANGQPDKYGCHFLLWEGEFIVDAVNKHPDLAARFFPPQAHAIAPELPLTRLQVICDESPDGVLLTFMCECEDRNSVLERTHLTRDDFDDLVAHSRGLTVQVANWNASLDASLKRVGRRLFDIIPGPVREALRRTTGYVRLTSNLHVLPFELAYDPERDAYLGSPHRIGRMHFSDSGRDFTAARRSPPSALLLAPNSEELPGMNLELDGLAAMLKTRLPVVALTGAGATLAAAARSMSEGSHSILHFAGHGVTRPDDEFGLVFSDQIVRPTDLVSFGQDAKLVFLNCCGSGAALDRIGRDLTQPLGAVLVGFVGPVTAPAGTIIALETYQQILAGATLGAALHAGTSRQRDELPHDYSWVSLVLFGDPRLVLAH